MNDEKQQLQALAFIPEPSFFILELSILILHPSSFNLHPSTALDIRREDLKVQHPRQSVDEVED